MKYGKFFSATKIIGNILFLIMQHKSQKIAFGGTILKTKIA